MKTEIIQKQLSNLNHESNRGTVLDLSLIHISWVQWEVLAGPCSWPEVYLAFCLIWGSEAWVAAAVEDQFPRHPAATGLERRRVSRVPVPGARLLVWPVELCSGSLHFVVSEPEQTLGLVSGSEALAVFTG